MIGGSSFGALQRRSVFLAGLGVLLFVLVVAILELGGLDSAGLASRHLAARMRSADVAFTWGMAPPLLSMGVGVGLAGGLLGMGGGALLVAGLLLLFGMDIFLARAISMEVMCFTAASAAMRHTMDGREPGRLAWPMVPPALVAVLVGVGLGYALRGSALTHLFGFFMIFVGFFTLAQLVADPVEELVNREFANRHRGKTRAQRVVGTLHGFLCGLLGISGGVITIPVQQLALRTPAHHAIAASLIVSAVCAFVGGIVMIVLGVRRGDFALAPFLAISLLLGLGAAVGAQVGARICGRTNSSVLRLLFVVVSFGAGLSILL